MRRVVVVQARMTSTRLPGKVLMDLAGAPHARARDRAAAPLPAGGRDRARDDHERRRRPARRARRPARRALAPRLRARRARAATLGAAREADADVVVRVTSDCPLIDRERGRRGDRGAGPADRLRRQRARAPAAARAGHRGAVARHARARGPDGDLHARARARHLVHPQRAPGAVRDPLGACGPYDAADLRWTVDTPEDLELARRLYADLDLAQRAVAFPEILAHVRAHPELAAINAHVEQKRS